MKWKYPFKRALSSAGVSSEDPHNVITSGKSQVVSKPDTVVLSTSPEINGCCTNVLKSSDVCQDSSPITPGSSVASQDECRETTGDERDESLPRNSSSRDAEESLAEQSLGTCSTEQDEDEQFSQNLYNESGTETEHTGTLEALSTRSHSTFESSPLDDPEDFESYCESKLEKEAFRLADTWSEAGMDENRDSCDVGLLREGVFIMTSDQIKQELLAILLHDLVQLPETPQLPDREPNDDVIETTSYPMQQVASSQCDSTMQRVASEVSLPLASNPSQQALLEGNTEATNESTNVHQELQFPEPAAPDEGYELHVLVDSEGKKFARVLGKTTQKEIGTKMTFEDTVSNELARIPFLRTQTVLSTKSAASQPPRPHTSPEPGYELCVLVDPVGKTFTRVLVKTNQTVSDSAHPSIDKDMVELSKIPMLRDRSLMSAKTQVSTKEIKMTTQVRPPNPPESGFEMNFLVDAKGEKFTRVTARQDGHVNTTIELSRIQLKPSATIDQDKAVRMVQQPILEPGYELSELVDSTGKKFTRVLAKSEQTAGAFGTVELARIPLLRKQSHPLVMKPVVKPTPTTQNDVVEKVQPSTSFEPGYEMCLLEDSKGKTVTQVLGKTEDSASCTLGSTVRKQRVPSLRNKIVQSVKVRATSNKQAANTTLAQKSMAETARIPLHRSATEDTASKQARNATLVQESIPLEPSYELRMLKDWKGKKFTQILARSEQQPHGSTESVTGDTTEVGRVPLRKSTSKAMMKQNSETPEKSRTSNPNTDKKKRWNVFRSWKEKRNEKIAATQRTERTDTRTVPKISDVNSPPENTSVESPMDVSQSTPWCSLDESLLLDMLQPSDLAFVELYERLLSHIFDTIEGSVLESDNEGKTCAESSAADQDQKPLVNSETALTKIGTPQMGASNIDPIRNLFTMFITAIDKGIAALIAPGLYHCALSDDSFSKGIGFTTPNVNDVSDILDVCFTNIEQLRDRIRMLTNPKSDNLGVEIPALALEKVRKLEAANADMMDSCFSKVEQLQDVLNGILLQNLSLVIHSAGNHTDDNKLQALTWTDSPPGEPARSAPSDLAAPKSQWSNWLNDSLFKQYSGFQSPTSSLPAQCNFESTKAAQSHAPIAEEAINTKSSSKEGWWKLLFPSLGTTGANRILPEQKEMTAKETQNGSSPSTSNETGRDNSDDTQTVHRDKPPLVDETKPRATERPRVIRARRVRSDWSASKESMIPVGHEARDDMSIGSSSTIDSNESFGSTNDGNGCAFF